MINNKFKFDVVIGNPPYQGKSIGNDKKFTPPIYHKFLEQAYDIGNIAELITPGRFLFNAGATPKAWNRKMLSDKHLKVIFYEPNSKKVFSNVGITGGVAVTYRDRSKDFGAIGTYTPYAELKHILKKVKSKDFKSFSKLIYAPENYRLTQKLHDDFPDIEAQLSKGNKFTVASNIFDKLGDIFRNVKPSGSSEQYVGLYGRQNNRRKLKWIKSKYIKAPDNLKNYKILVPEFNGSGAIGEVLATPLIGDSLIGGTKTFITIGNFKNINCAKAAMKYIKSKFARAMLGTLKVTPGNRKRTWGNVPLQDFTQHSDIDWSKSISEIDQQLYKKYGLNEQEIEFIETNVKEMK